MILIQKEGKQRKLQPFLVKKQKALVLARRLLSCHPCGLGNVHVSAVFRHDYGVSCWSVALSML